jgi:hypothetical protein
LGHETRKTVDVEGRGAQLNRSDGNGKRKKKETNG